LCETEDLPLALPFLAVHRQLSLFRDGILSPVDVLKAQIEQIEIANTALNAITFLHFGEALNAARESEARYRRGDPRPLEGITVAVKDEYSKKGWKVTQGSKIFAHEVKRENHPVIDKLLAAGAVLHIQTTAPELYLLAVTWSDLWGVTRNPWNRAYTPGGSSGGSAVVLASGMSSLAIGSDMGGSIRIPCALNGLYGSKPAYGRIASPDPSALVPHASPGPLARNLRDLILLQNVMAGPAPDCPAVLRPKLELPFTFPERNFKLALCLDQGWARLEPDVRASTCAAVKILEVAGAVVDEIDLGLDTNDTKMRETVEKALFSTALGADLLALAPRAGCMTRYGKRFVDLAASMGPKQAKEAAEETLRLYSAVDRTVFRKGYDGLITATVGTTQIAADYDPTQSSPVIDGNRVDPYAGWFLTSLFSLLNWMPVINVPTGLTANGLPAGIQIATRPYDDITAFEIATLYQRSAEPLSFEQLLRGMSQPSLIEDPSDAGRSESRRMRRNSRASEARKSLSR
jgi:Asp-tRNA(Asn)/Glu-tRNA(Gln) amidotransferase A subunit family amidase